MLYAALLFLVPPGAESAEVQAGSRKAEECVACHTINGSSTQPTGPSLSGQPPLYIYFQLLQFRERRRTDPEMSPIAANLSDRDMKDLAAYYATQTPVAAAREPRDARKVAAGREAAVAQHCASCHAPGLVGQDHIPRLAGLSYEYLLKELRAFKAQTRADMDGTMTTVAQQLSEEDIENLAQYVADLPLKP